jgi:hypothetical protein
MSAIDLKHQVLAILDIVVQRRTGETELVGHVRQGGHRDALGIQFACGLVKELIAA